MMNWAELRAFANPPVESDRESTGPDAPTKAELLLVAPVWKAQVWYPVLLEMLVHIPLLIPLKRDLIRGHSPREPSRGNSPTSRVGYLRQRYKDCQISEGATKLLLASWRQKSSKTYDSLFGKWTSWCSERDSDPLSCPIGEVVNFLAHLFEQGYQYRSKNSYRPAVSSVHEKVDGYEVGQHPLVSRTIKGIFHERPLQPRYSETWSVATVTTYIESCVEMTHSHSRISLTKQCCYLH